MLAFLKDILHRVIDYYNFLIIRTIYKTPLLLFSVAKMMYINIYFFIFLENDSKLKVKRFSLN